MEIVADRIILSEPGLPSLKYDKGAVLQEIYLGHEHSIWYDMSKSHPQVLLGHHIECSEPQKPPPLHL